MISETEKENFSLAQRCRLAEDINIEVSFFKTDVFYLRHLGHRMPCPTETEMQFTSTGAFPLIEPDG